MAGSQGDGNLCNARCDRRGWRHRRNLEYLMPRVSSPSYRRRPSPGDKESHGFQRHVENYPSAARQEKSCLRSILDPAAPTLFVIVVLSIDPIIRLQVSWTSPRSETLLWILATAPKVSRYYISVTGVCKVSQLNSYITLNVTIQWILNVCTCYAM